MRASDIKFQLNSGDHKGEEYGFTLAIVNNKKAWTSTRLFLQPPTMIREKIDLVLTAREANVPISGAIELKLVNKILEHLENISLETDAVTLVGIDKEERLVRVGEHGAELNPVIQEKGKEPEYQVTVTCWGLYEETNA